MPQLRVDDVLLYLETVQRAYGPDVPLWVVSAPDSACDPACVHATTMAPLDDVRLDVTAGAPALLLVGAGVRLFDDAEYATPANDHDTPVCVAVEDLLDLEVSYEP